jgi:hypothetical protein
VDQLDLEVLGELLAAAVADLLVGADGVAEGLLVLLAVGPVAECAPVPAPSRHRAFALLEYGARSLALDRHDVPRPVYDPDFQVHHKSFTCGNCCEN